MYDVSMDNSFNKFRCDICLYVVHNVGKKNWNMETFIGNYITIK
jgi:hypothetical protein